MHLKSGLDKKGGLSTLEGDNLAVYFYPSASEIWPDKKGGLLTLEGDNLAVYFYPSASEIWP
jgi:peroxiredoxin